MSSDEGAPGPTRATRKVSSLTASQIQHKRDLDRKAQQALRQRTKTRIQELENDLARLKESVSERERAMFEDIQRLREENRQLKSSLQSIGRFALGSVSDLQGTGSPQHMTTDVAPQSSSNPDATDSLRSDRVPSLPDLRPGSRNSDVGRTRDSAIDERDRITEASTHQQMSHSPIPHAQDTPTSHVPSQCGPVMCPVQRTYHTDASHFNPATPQIDTASSIAYALPKHVSATCPLDHILLDYIAKSQDLVARGAPIDEVIGPDQPRPQDLLNPSPVSMARTVSRIMGEILATFEHVKLPEKMAFMYLMHRTTRWQISPNAESYTRIPAWLRPTATQIIVPHPAWIDNIPWPRVRDILIENPDRYPFAFFSEFYSHNVSVNWSYSPEDIFLETDDGPIINTIFEKHIQKLGNWTVSRHFREYFSDWTSDVYVIDG